MNIAHKFLEVVVFPAYNEFVPVLKQLPVAFVAVVETDRMSGQKPPHEFSKTARTGAKQKMSMIGHENPCIAACPGFEDKL